MTYASAEPSESEYDAHDPCVACCAEQGCLSCKAANDAGQGELCDPHRDDCEGQEDDYYEWVQNTPWED